MTFLYKYYKINLNLNEKPHLIMSISQKDKAIALIRRAERILCVTKSDPREDGMVCVVAAEQLGQRLQKETVAILPEGISTQLEFLTNGSEIHKELGEKGDFVISLSTENANVERVKYTIEEESVDILITPKSGNFSDKDVYFKHNTAKFDLILVFDAPNLESLGSIFSDNTELFAQCPTVNISAESTTEDFAKINLIDPTKSSSTEIFYDLIESDHNFKEALDEDLATTLLTGIIASTGSFLETNTTTSSFEAASHLQEIGARQSDIIEYLFKRKSFATLKLWGRIFSQLQLDPVHRITWSKLSQSDLNEADANDKDVDRISDEILRFTEHAEISVLFVEQKNQILAQLRTQNQNIDWSEITENKDYKIAEKGIDLIFTNESLAEVEVDLMHEILDFQQQRHHLETDQPLQTLAPKSKKETDTLHTAFPMKLKTKKEAKKVKPTPPAEIPFVAPNQPHEVTGKVETHKTPDQDTPPGTQAAEVIIDTQKKGIPDWLKKSFPDNQ